MESERKQLARKALAANLDVGIMDAQEVREEIQKLAATMKKNPCDSNLGMRLIACRYRQLEQATNLVQAMRRKKRSAYS